MMPVAAAIAAIGVVGSLVAGNKAKKASKAANAAQRAINKLKNEQSKRAFLRQFRQAQAATLVSGIASGVTTESSVVQGELAGQKTQAVTGIKEFVEFDKLGAAQTAAINRQAGANFAGSVFGAVTAFATSPGGGDFLDSLKFK